MSDISVIHESFHIFFIQNRDAHLCECCGQEPLTGNEVMGKGSIVDFPVSAGGTFSLEDSQIHRFFLNLLNYPVHALLINGGKIQKYLQHERLRLKAEFSSAISITNPDRSTSLFDTLLTTHSWEEKDIVKKHFNMFDKYL